MIKAAKNWVRRVIPFDWLLLALIAASALPPANILICLTYAWFRAVAFHPLFAVDYNRFLRTSPWQYPQPLPYGPLHLVPQDLLFLALVTGLPALLRGSPAETFFVSAALGVTGFVLPWAVIHAFGFLRLGVRFHAYGIAVILPLTLFPKLLPYSPYAWMVLVMLLLFFVQRGISLALSQFPWEPFSLDEVQKKTREQQIGWPHSVLAPSGGGSEVFVKLRTPDRAALCLLVGWYALAFGSGTAQPGTLMREALYPDLLCILLAAITALTYLRTARPPLDVWGRIAKGRFIIPGFDKVLVVPVVILLVALFMPAFLVSLGTPLLLVSPLIKSTSVALVCFVQPSLDNWLLTGDHQLVFGGNTSGFYMQL